MTTSRIVAVVLGCIAVAGCGSKPSNTVTASSTPSAKPTEQVLFQAQTKRDQMMQKQSAYWLTHDRGHQDLLKKTQKAAR